MAKATINLQKEPGGIVKISECKAHLTSTDFKMTVDYFAALTVEQQEALVTSRAEARAFLKANGY